MVWSLSGDVRFGHSVWAHQQKRCKKLVIVNIISENFQVVKDESHSGELLQYCILHANFQNDQKNAPCG